MRLFYQAKDFYFSYAKCLRDSDGIPPKHLDHSHYLDIPGQVFTAKKQCEILLRDRDAVVSPNQELSAICYSMQCKTPHRSGYYFAGPALEGTECGRGKVILYSIVFIYLSVLFRIQII